MQTHAVLILIGMAAAMLLVAFVNLDYLETRWQEDHEWIYANLNELFWEGWNLNNS